MIVWGCLMGMSKSYSPVLKWGYVHLQSTDAQEKLALLTYWVQIY
jgi:hypothetical protein